MYVNGSTVFPADFADLPAIFSQESMNESPPPLSLLFRRLDERINGFVETFLVLGAVGRLPGSLVN
jgi:hypothetical protein